MMVIMMKQLQILPLLMEAQELVVRQEEHGTVLNVGVRQTIFITTHGQLHG